MIDTSLFKTKDYNQVKHVQTVYGGGKKPNELKIKKQSEDNIIKNLRNVFKLNKEIKTIKYRIIKDIIREGSF